MRARVTAALSLVALAACALLVGFSGASFNDTTQQNPQTVSAVADFLPPTAGASVIAKSKGGVAGYIKAGGTYYVYANVTDSGNPASGIASVKADVSAITTGQTAAALVAGSYSVGGVSYNYRSAELTAKGTLAAGSSSYTLALADSAGNSGTQSFSVTVDNGPFAGAGFATANGSSTAGKPEAGDTVTFTYKGVPDPASIVSGWNGSAPTAVSVTIVNNSTVTVLTVTGAALGSVDLQGEYVGKGKTSTFTASSMSLSGSALTITLGSDASGNAKSETSKNGPVWTPSSSAYDRAGNASSTATVTGAKGKQF
jgi:hypothetical protein